MSGYLRLEQQESSNVTHDFGSQSLEMTISPVQNEQNNDKRLLRLRACPFNCCFTNSNCKEALVTTDNAIIPLVGRSAGQKPFIPQSYNYIDFEKNQIRAIGQKNLRLTLEVVQQVFAVGYDNVLGQERALVTNHKVLEHCRFFPEYKGLTQAEMTFAAENDVIIAGPLQDSLIGYFIQDAHTVAGKEFLLVRGSNPTNNRQTIKNRQNVIRSLIEETALRLTLEDILDTYGRYENEFCSRLTPDATKLPGRIENYLKFAMLDIPESVGRRINAYIRESTTLLSINNYIKTTQDGFTVLLLVVIALALVGYCLSVLFPSFFVSRTKLLVTAFVNRYIGQTGAMISALQSLNSRPTKVFASMLGTLCAAAKAPDLFGYWRADIRVKIALQAKMVSVAKCVRSIIKIHELLTEYPHLVSSLEHFCKIKALIESENSKVQKMLLAIKAPTLDEASMLFNFGPVIVAWNLLLEKDVRQLVLTAIVGMGELDSCLSLAKKVVHCTPELPFSLPYIVDELDAATISLVSAHFPPVSCRASNFNIAHADQRIDLPPLSILTAENGAGKTTFALAWINVLLSTQSFGIAPCAPGSRLSLFDVIITSMGVTDSNIESSHESHERYDKELLSKLDNHPQEKVFVFLDELYRGTHEEKGTVKLGELAGKLSLKADQLRAVFVTHFRSFARDRSIDAVRYTTKKGPDGKPSGVLEEGIYDFPTTA